MPPIGRPEGVFRVSAIRCDTMRCGGFEPVIPHLRSFACLASPCYRVCDRHPLHVLTCARTWQACDVLTSRVGTTYRLLCFWGLSPREPGYIPLYCIALHCIAWSYLASTSSGFDMFDTFDMYGPFQACGYLTLCLLPLQSRSIRFSTLRVD